MLKRLEKNSRLDKGLNIVYTVLTNIEKFILWGCTGFDAVIGRSGLRVRALFPLINEQTKLNANDNVIAFPSRARLAA